MMRVNSSDALESSKNSAFQMETEVFCLGHEYTVEWKYTIIFTRVVQSAWKFHGDTITKNIRVVYFVQKYNSQ